MRHKLCIMAFLTCLTCNIYAKTNIDVELKQLEKTLEETEHRLNQLKKKRLKRPVKHQKYSLFATDFDRYPTNPNPPPFIISNDDASREIELHAWMQVDQDLFFDSLGLYINNGVSSVPVINKNTVDRFWIRRLRPDLEGKLNDFIQFYFNLDFGQSQVRLFDGFGDINYWRILGLQFGQQMSLLSGIENYFNNFSYLSRAFTQEMSFSAMLAPDREFGFVFHGSIGPSGTEPYYRGLSYLGFDDFFSYQLGILSGTPDNTQPGTNPVNLYSFNYINSSLSNKAFEGRIFFNPFIQEQNFILQHLGLGFAGSSERANRNNSNSILASNYSLPDMLSIGQNPIFIYNSDVIATGNRTRLHPQMVWSYGPLGLLADWTQTLQNLENISASANLNDYNNPVQKQINKAAQIQVIYNLSQEHFNLFHLKPNQNFHLWDTQALGAFQAVFRLSQLQMDPNIFNQYSEDAANNLIYYTFADPRISVQKANAWSIGLNWYWTENLRISAEYDETHFIGGCSTAAMDSNNQLPGCLTGQSYNADSQISNRPPERIFMSRFQVTF